MSDVRAVHKLPGQTSLRELMICTRAEPTWAWRQQQADGLFRQFDERKAGAAYHARIGVAAMQSTGIMRLGRINCLRVRPHKRGLQVIGGNFL